MIFDGHSDLLYDVTRRRLMGETRVLERHHLDRLKEGGVEGLVLAIWTSRSHGETFWEQVRGGETPQSRVDRMIFCAQEELAECDAIRLVRTAAEAEKAREQGKLYAFLGVEGMECIEDDPAGVDQFARLGARLGMLTWNEDNLLASGAGGDPDRGLTAAGRETVRRMERLGMLVDVSHLNDPGFRDVMRLCQGPVIASHSNCRALCNVRRNLTDDQLRAIRDTGGLVGLNSFHGFVHEDPEQQTARMLAVHAAHIADLIGVEHLACGFDFCHYMGPGYGSAKGLEDESRAGSFLACLEELGMNEAEREQVARGNLLRLLG